MNSLKTVLERVLKETPNYDKAQSKFKIFELWPQIVGQKLSQKCWPIHFFEDGTLIIASQSSAWLGSLKYLEPQILQRYERLLKEKKVLRIRFKSGTGPGDQ